MERNVQRTQAMRKLVGVVFAAALLVGCGNADDQSSGKASGSGGSAGTHTAQGGSSAGGDAGVTLPKDGGTTTGGTSGSNDAGSSPCGFDGDESALTDLSTMSDIWRSDYSFAEIWDKPGFSLESWRTNAHVFVMSDDVRLANFYMDPTGATGGYYSIRTDDREAGAGLTIENGTIATTQATDDGPVKGILVAVENVTIRDVDLSGSHDGISIGASHATVENACIHDLAEAPSAHNDGIEIYSGSSIVIRNSKIDNQNDQTSAINITNDFGPIDDVLIENVTLSGGGYTIYVRGDGSSGEAVTNIRFRNVVVARPGFYGVISYQNAPGAIVEWDVRDEKGNAIPEP